MGQIRKVGDTYYIEFYARGLMYSQIAGPDLEAAQELLEATEKKIAGGEALTVVRQIDLPVFFEQFLRYSAEEFGVRSTHRFAAAIDHFYIYLKQQQPHVTQLAQITPSVIEAYKSSRQPSTKAHLVNFTLLLLREIMEYGIKIGFLNDNPTLHVRLLEWRPRQVVNTKRSQLAKELFGKGIGIGRAAKLLKLPDVARLMFYANSIPLSRQDIYN